MFIGHYAPAFIAATLPKAPRLGTLFIAAQLVDIAFFLFVLLDIEHMRLSPGMTLMNGLDLYSMPYTHSLAGSLVFGGAAAIAVGLIMRRHATGTSASAARRDGNGNTIVVWPRAMAIGLIAGAVVVSHWFLDLLVHAPDLTLTGTPPKLGLGLWNYPLIEMPLELGITGAALGFYLSHSTAKPGADLKSALWLGGVMVAVQMYNWFAPEPETMSAAMPVSALVAFAVFAFLAFRLDSTRRMKSDPQATESL
jgi:hypothetical protein